MAHRAAPCTECIACAKHPHRDASTSDCARVHGAAPVVTRTSSSRTSACTSPDASSGASARCDGRRVPVSYCAYAGFCARRRWCWAAALPIDPVRIAWTNAAWTSTATRIRVLGDIRHHARGRRRSRRHFSDGLVGAAPTPTLPALPACPAPNCPIAVVPMRLTCQCAMASHCCGAAHTRGAGRRRRR